MKYVHLSLIAMAALFALPAFADGVIDDAIKLSQGGVGEEVLVAWAEKQNAGSLSAQDIIHLKEGKVPDRAIATLIRSGSRMAAAPATAPAVERVPASAQEVRYVEPSTQYASQPATTYVYTDNSYPVYYSYPYYSSYPYYYGGYYPYYSSFGVGLNFGFGGRGFNHGGFRGGFRGGSGFRSGGFVSFGGRGRR